MAKKRPNIVAYRDANSGHGRAGVIDHIPAQAAGLSVRIKRQKGCRGQNNDGESNCHAASLRRTNGTNFKPRLALSVWRLRRNLRGLWCRLSRLRYWLVRAIDAA